MARIPKEAEMALLHRYITNLVRKFGREQSFTLADVQSGGDGGGGRLLIEAIRDLPESVAIEHLKHLDQIGWVKLNLTTSPWNFEITPSFQNLPDQITPEDIMAEKITFLSNRLAEKFPAEYGLLKDIQKKLLKATTEQDYSEIGNLCVHFWEDFTDKLWIKYIPDISRPPKDKTKQKLTPIVEKYVKSQTSCEIYKALGDLFEAVSDLAQKTKHRSSSDRPVTLRDAKLALLLTVVISEEILNYIA